MTGNSDKLESTTLKRADTNWRGAGILANRSGVAHVNLRKQVIQFTDKNK